jgi:hypothetical protein
VGFLCVILNTFKGDYIKVIKDTSSCKQQPTGFVTESTQNCKTGATFNSREKTSINGAQKHIPKRK